jgi:hypothetical protein
MKKIKILSSVVLLSLLIIPLLSVNAQVRENKPLPTSKPTVTPGRPTSTLIKINNREERASTTINNSENRENNLERIRERISSSTASTSDKKLGRLSDQQRERVEKTRERILNREIRVIAALERITDKIQERINILQSKGYNMTTAKEKLAEAKGKIVEMTSEANKISSLINTANNIPTGDEIFEAIKTAQAKIKSLAKETHTILVNTIREIKKNTPQRTTTATSTATTTDIKQIN